MLFVVTTVEIAFATSEKLSIFWEAFFIIKRIHLYFTNHLFRDNYRNFTYSKLFVIIGSKKVSIT